MVYRNKFVAAIKVNGCVLREIEDVVSLPFGSEYSIFLKNLDSLRVSVSLSIDGQDVAEGTKMILSPNETCDLERFIRNRNLNQGNRFKFIERTDAIEHHRGIGAEDGLVRIEFWKELVRPVYVKPPVFERPYYPPPRPPCEPWPKMPKWFAKGPHPRAASRQRKSMSAPSASGSRMDTRIYGASNRSNDQGITVPGSQSGQRFAWGGWFETEPQSEVIIIRLRGEVAGIPIEQPITVDHKPECETCGRKNKSTSRFCSQCGTALVLV